MTEEFKCPNCGAPLDVPGDGVTTLRCPFCSTAVIVPEILRTSSRPRVEIYVSQPTETPHLPSSSIQFISTTSKASSDAVRRGLKVAGGAAAATGCVSVGVTVAVILVVLGFVLFMLTVPGGPLEMPWAKINPFGWAKLVMSFGGEGTGPGLFDDERAIAVDSSSGRIYVADYQGGRVQAFDANGKFLLQWLVGDRKTIIPSMSADRKGVVYVVAEGKLLRYNGENGKLLGEVQNSELHDYIEYVAATADGGLLVIKQDETIVRLDSDLKPDLVLQNAVSSVSDETETITRVAADGSGNLYILAWNNNAVFKYARDGKFLTRFGGQGDEKGQLDGPYAIALDGKGSVFISDFNGIQIFGVDGRYIDSFDVPGVGFGLVINDQGELFVTSNRRMVLKYVINR